MHDAERSAAPALKDAFALAADGTAGAVEVNWFADQLAPGAGPVLDASCGIGRMLVPLQQRGRGVHGVDASASALALCAERLGALVGDVPLLRQPPAELNLPFRYTAAYFAAGTFEQLVDPLAAACALQRIAQHLVAPGLLIVDLCLPAEALHPPGAALVEVRTVNGAGGTIIGARSETVVDVEFRQITRRTRYERRLGTAITERQDDRTALTWYSEDEIVAMVRECGFGDVQWLASPHPLISGEQRRALVAHLQHR